MGDYEFPVKAEWLWKENDCYNAVLDFITSGEYQKVVEYIDDSKGAAFVVGMTYALGLMSKECSKYFVKADEEKAESDIKPESEETKWIYVTDRVPGDDDYYDVTILDEHGDSPFLYTYHGWYLEEAKCWIVDGRQTNDVIAWMLHPEPAKPKKG